MIGILAEACCNFVSVSRIEGFDLSPYDMLDTLSSAEFIRHGAAPTLSWLGIRGCLRGFGGADNSNTAGAAATNAAAVKLLALFEPAHRAAVRLRNPGGVLRMLQITEKRLAVRMLQPREKGQHPAACFDPVSRRTASPRAGPLFRC